MQHFIDIDRLATLGAVGIVGVAVTGYLLYRGVRTTVRGLRKKKA